LEKLGGHWHKSDDLIFFNLPHALIEFQPFSLKFVDEMFNNLSSNFPYLIGTQKLRLFKWQKLSNLDYQYRRTPKFVLQISKHR
jgi:hypothetical protein